MVRPGYSSHLPHGYLPMPVITGKSAPTMRVLLGKATAAAKLLVRAWQCARRTQTRYPGCCLEQYSVKVPVVFDDITFVQRVNTVGGIAPSSPGEVVGQLAEVPYTAEYYFYRGPDEE